MSLSDFAALVGAIASAAALAAFVNRGYGWHRQQNRRRELGEYLRRLRRLDVGLTAVVSEAEARLTIGVGWSGFAIWPPALRGHLVYLDGLLDELERTTAALRAFEADGAVERLREDLERLTVVMREAGELYKGGVIDCYRDSMGGPVPLSATGREPTPILPEDRVQEAESLRREAQLLFRTAHHQLHDENVAEAYQTRWPTSRRARAEPSDPSLWGSEIRPIEWSESSTNRTEPTL